MSTRKCLCGVGCVVRTFHSALVLGIPTSLLFVNSDLREALIDLEDPVYGITYVLLVVLSLSLYYTACFVEPGYVQKTKGNLKTSTTSEYEDSSSDDYREEEEGAMIKEKKKLYRYCDYCEIEQPMRSKHCDDCKKCIRKYDHHCPWLETCVGERNHKYFWMFLVSTCVLVIWTLIITWNSFEEELTWKEWFKSNVIRLLDMLVLVIGGMSVVGLFCFHSYLMIRGLTTWEVVSRERITYLKYLDYDFNPFDEGCIKNIYYFLTNCKLKRWEVTYEKKADIVKFKKNVI